MYEVMKLSGRRKDPQVWDKWWKRAIASVPIHLSGEGSGKCGRGSAGGEGAWGKDQMESDLSTLVNIDAQKLGAPSGGRDTIERVRRILH